MRSFLFFLCSALLAASMVARPAAGAEGRQIRYGGSVCAVAFSPDGGMLATAGGPYGQAGEVVLWDAETGAQIRTLKGHSATARALAFLPDGKTLISAGDDKAVIAWDVAAGTAKRTVLAHTGRVSSLAVSADGKVLATGGWDGLVRIWEAQSLTPVRKLAAAGAIAAVAVSPDGSLVAASCVNTDGTVRLWSARTGDPVRTLPGHTFGTTALAFSPDGTLLASAGGSQDRTVRVWDPKSGELKRAIEILPASDAFQQAWANALAFAPDGKTLAAGCSDWSVKLFGPRSGDLLAVLKGHRQPLLGVAFSPDGVTLASGCTYKDEGSSVLRTWNVRQEVQR